MSLAHQAACWSSAAEGRAAPVDAKVQAANAIDKAEEDRRFGYCGSH